MLRKWNHVDVDGYACVLYIIPYIHSYHVDVNEHIYIYTYVCMYIMYMYTIHIPYIHIHMNVFLAYMCIYLQGTAMPRAQICIVYALCCQMDQCFLSHSLHFYETLATTNYDIPLLLPSPLFFSLRQWGTVDNRSFKNPLQSHMYMRVAKKHTISLAILKFLAIQQGHMMVKQVTLKTHHA